MAPPLLAVGYIARAHGVRGRVLVSPFNDDSEGLERVRALWLRPRASSAEPVRREVAHGERVNLGYIFTLRGLDDMDEANALKGSEVLVERAELPELQSDQIWAADLVGMKVRDASGNERGEVVGLEHAGPNDLLQVKTAAGEVLVPLGLVREIDEANKTLSVESPEGLFDVEAKA